MVLRGVAAAIFWDMPLCDQYLFGLGCGGSIDRLSNGSNETSPIQVLQSGVRFGIALALSTLDLSPRNSSVSKMVHYESVGLFPHDFRLGLNPEVASCPRFSSFH